MANDKKEFKIVINGLSESIDAVKSPYNSFIANKYISPNDKDFNFPCVNL